MVELNSSLKRLDESALRESINRYTMLLFDDVARMQPTCKHAAWSREAADAAIEAKRAYFGNPNIPRPALQKFIKRFLNKVVYHENGTSETVYNCDSMVNFWGIINNGPPFLVLWSEFHPGVGNDFCSLKAVTEVGSVPFFPPSYFQVLFANCA